MIISHGRQFIFVHIPKTGGTAMALALENRAMKDDILIGDTPKAKRRKHRLKDSQTRGRLWKHSTLADVEGLVSPDQMADYCVFTLVRNPWDRMVSYYHWLQTQTFAHPAVALSQSVSFSAFLNHPQTVNSLRAHPTDSYVTDSGGTCHADHYVRLEHWQNDLAPIWDHVGFRFDLPVANTSQRPRDYRGFYTDADAALIGEIAAADIKRSAYRFDPID